MSHTRADEEIKAISRFSTLMLEKLAQNRSKPHWSNCDTDWLHDRLLEEIVELNEAIEDYFEALGRMNVRKASQHEVRAAMVAVRLEAADVANFCMMLADNFETEIETLPEDRN